MQQGILQTGSSHPNIFSPSKGYSLRTLINVTRKGLLARILKRARQKLIFPIRLLRHCFKVPRNVNSCEGLHARDFLASPEGFLVFAQEIMPTNGCASEKALKGRLRALFGVGNGFRTKFEALRCDMTAILVLLVVIYFG